MAKQRKTTIVLEPKLPRFSTVHKRGGAGPHQDKRTKRCRTRAAALTASLKD